MGFIVQPESCNTNRAFVVLKGTGTQSEFRSFVENYIRDHSTTNAQLAHGKSMEDVLELRGDEYFAVVQMQVNFRA